MKYKKNVFKVHAIEEGGLSIALERLRLRLP